MTGAQASFMGPYFWRLSTIWVFSPDMAAIVTPRDGLVAYNALAAMPRTTDTQNPVPPWELENPICPHNSPAMNLSYGWITDTYFLMFHSFYTYSNLQLFLEGYIFKKKKKRQFFSRCFTYVYWLKIVVNLFSTLMSKGLFHRTSRNHWDSNEMCFSNS